MKIIQRLLPFNFGDIVDPTAILPGEVHSWVEYPQLLFKPMGLLFWGATDQTYIKSIKCGNSWEVSTNASPIPARYFEAGKSFDEMKRLADIGELHLNLEQRQIVEMVTLEVSMALRIDTSGPFKNFCVWGKSSGEHGPMPQHVHIAKSGDEFVGVVNQLTLDGPEELLTVRAPSSADCATIIAAQRRGRF